MILASCKTACFFVKNYLVLSLAKHNNEQSLRSQQLLVIVIVALTGEDACFFVP